MCIEWYCLWWFGVCVVGVYCVMWVVWFVCVCCVIECWGVYDVVCYGGLWWMIDELNVWWLWCESRYGVCGCLFCYWDVCVVVWEWYEYVIYVVLFWIDDIWCWFGFVIVWIWWFGWFVCVWWVVVGWFVVEFVVDVDVGWRLCVVSGCVNFEKEDWYGYLCVIVR